MCEAMYSLYPEPKLTNVTCMPWYVLQRTVSEYIFYYDFQAKEVQLIGI
jgi:hypothetical protein